jgi:hypothetical protein
MGFASVSAHFRIHVIHTSHDSIFGAKKSERSQIIKHVTMVHKSLDVSDGIHARE